MDWQEKVKTLPDGPGVYLFKDASGTVIYVGKAVSLKNRVRTYLQSGSFRDPKVRLIVDRAKDLEYIVTDSEVEALILESNLIKEHRPRYNVVLKDDKSYPYLKVTVNEDYPRVFITRRVLKDGARYFGPYTRAGAVHETLRLLKKLFPFRSCKQKEPVFRGRPCLNYHIKRCLGPCCGLVSREEYRAMIRDLCLFLEGRQEEVVKNLRARMEEAAGKLEFERAAELRDQIQAVEEVVARQKVLSSRMEDQDVIAVARGVELACVMVFFVRGGRLIGRDHFLLDAPGQMSRAEVITSFIKQYYLRAEFIPQEVLVEEALPEELAAIERWLSDKKGSRVHVYVPRRGEKRELVEMVGKNALLALKEHEMERSQREYDADRALGGLARALGLERVPDRLECFDVSTIQGTSTVASMVVFERGRPCKDQYRRFKIKTVQGVDDFAAIREAVGRRFARGQEEQDLIKTGQLSTREAGFYRMPDLVIVDGGKGQLAAARSVMEELGFGHIPVFGLAKEEELLYAPDRLEPLRLPPDSPELHLLQRLRDEAHRFAVSYHRRLRDRRSLKSLLEEIEGIGPVRRRELLKAYATLEEIRQASPEELASLPGMNRKAALAVYDFFHGQEAAKGGIIEKDGK